MNKHFRHIISCISITLFLLCGCSNTDSKVSAHVAESEIETISQNFDEFTTRLFTESVAGDAMTLHYQLKDPSAYNIELEDINLGRINLNDQAELKTKTAGELDELLSFDYHSLTDDQQLTYNILKQYFETELSIDSEKLFFYPEYFSSTSGIHSLLPILFSEYAFYNQQDIETYLDLLLDIPDYFHNLLEYEQVKSESGLFMSDESADEVIQACKTFIADPDNNMLIEIFPEKLDTVSGLSDEATTDYIKRNDEYIRNAVIPAYEDLINGFESLKGTGTNDKGLVYFDDGAEYYTYLIRSSTGSDKTPDEMIEWIEDTISADMTQLAYLFSADQSLINSFSSDFDISISDPQVILTALQNCLTDDFPAPVTDQYTLKYVPESLEASMNPAFYLIPPVDVLDSNVIYLNNSQLNSHLSLFTTLAHEGYPGHLYQQTAFSATHPSPVRQILNIPGYVEGWATYVENMSYNWSGLDENLSQAMAINQEVTLCLYARIDLGVHYEGWTEDDILKYLSVFGIDEPAASHEIFRAVVTDPASYLPYCIGSLEFKELRNAEEKILADDFDLQKFHQQVLEIGPCQFDILEQYLEK